MAKEITDPDRQESHRQRLPANDAAQLADAVAGLVCRDLGVADGIAHAAGNAAHRAFDGFMADIFDRLAHAETPFWSISRATVPVAG
jgi:hypothetical protein